MRVSFIYLFSFLFSAELLLAKTSAGQRMEDTYITLGLHNVSLDEAFRKIEKSTNYFFAYQPKLLAGYKVTFPKASRTVKATLEIVLQGTDLSFRQAGQNIVIYRQPYANHVWSYGDSIGVPSDADTTISGMVTNAENQQPLANISVTVQGTKIGTTTDNNGHFSLQVRRLSGTLVISSVGYEDQRMSLNGGNTFQISLKPRSKSLDDVVVIGYGTQKRRDLTGTVNTMRGEDIVRSRATNAQEAMQGMLPGVDIKRNSGKPGSDFSLEIRGQNSITGSTQPLFVVDGVQNGNINDINPADIEKIDVLKDASSTAIFGSRGANGVVIVTTRRGSSGTNRIVYDAYAGVVNPYHLPKMMNGPQFVAYARDFFNEKAKLAGQSTPVPDNQIFSATELSNIAAGTFADWPDLIKRNALQTNHDLSITGGDSKTTYFLSAGYQLYQGTQKVENTKKYTLKLGADKSITDWLKAGGSIYGTFSDLNPTSLEAFRSSYRLRPTGSDYNKDGTLRFFPSEGESQITNPLFEFTNELRRTNYVRLLANVYVEATLLKGLKFRSSFTPDVTYVRSGVYDDTYTKSQAGTKPAAGTNSSNRSFNYTADNFLTYTNQVGEHKIDVTAGSSINYYQYDASSISVVGLPYKSLWFNVGSATAVTINGVTTQPSTSVSSGYSQQTIVGFVGRINYSFRNRYLLTLTGRKDGNSFFAPGYQWGFFPSGALAWVISDEEFMRRFPLINHLKVRVSYGQSGNAAQSGSLYPYVTQSTIAATQYDFNGSVANGFAPSNLAVKNLTWEKTKEYNAGIETNVLNNRISLQLDYYNKTSRGSILSEQIPAGNGFTTVTTNLGSVRNSGIELGVITTNVRTDKFTWTTNLNFAKNRNRIIDLYGNGTNDVGNQRFIGQKVRVVYAYKIIGVWQSSEAAQAAAYNQVPGQFKVQDITTSGLNTGKPTAPNLKPDGTINSNDRQILGSDIPNWFGGITNTFNYGPVDMSFTIYTRQGQFQQSTFYVQHIDGDQGRARFNAYQRTYWTPTTPSNKFANLGVEQDGGRRGASEFIDASYTKVSNITLGYTFSKRTLGKAFKSLRVYTTATNPFIWTKFIGWDPETADLNSGGLQDFKTRTLLLGVSVGL